MAEIKLVTFNICHGKGTDGKVSLNRTAGMLKSIDADVIALQEVDKRLSRSYFQDQTQVLAGHLGMDSAFAPNLHFLGGASYGNAVLSRYPILGQGNILLPGKGEQRGLQHCILELPGGDRISFFNTHLGLSSEDRTQQIRRIVGALRKASHPVLLAGDFNCSPNAPELKELKNQVSYPVFPEIKTYPATMPLYPIDQIYVSKDWELVEMAAVPGDASDHLPLVCRLSLI